jgi:hypothetical protein
MRRGTLAGVGALVFAVLTFVGAMIDNGPGGTYKQSDVEKYVRHSHHAAVFIGLYLALIGAVGLVVLLARLREAIADETRARVFWGLGIAGACAMVAGWAMHSAVPIAMAYGGKDVTVSPTVTFVFNEGGWAVLTAGAILIGLGLLTLVLGQVTLPAWVRWFTLVGAAGAVTAPAFFPFALFFIWALVIGIWLIAADRAPSAAPSTA